MEDEVKIIINICDNAFKDFILIFDDFFSSEKKERYIKLVNLRIRNLRMIYRAFFLNNKQGVKEFWEWYVINCFYIPGLINSILKAFKILKINLRILGFDFEYFELIKTYINSPEINFEIRKVITNNILNVFINNYNCRGCFTKIKRKRFCADCKLLFFCSPECQIKNWEKVKFEHKKAKLIDKGLKKKNIAIQIENGLFIGGFSGPFYNKKTMKIKATIENEID